MPLPFPKYCRFLFSFLAIVKTMNERLLIIHALSGYSDLERSLLIRSAFSFLSFVVVLCIRRQAGRIFSEALVCTTPGHEIRGEHLQVLKP